MNALYRGMDHATLDAAYNNTEAVADFPSVLAGFQARSARLYEATPYERDVPYGDGARQKFDWIPGRGPKAPILIYLHGGYWQTLTKEDFAFVAQGPLALGYNVVLAEYSLAPQSSMTQIVQEIGRLLDFLVVYRDKLKSLGPVLLVGHSAGGHLGLLHRSHSLLAHTMAISPLVDLEPISLSWLNAKLNLTPKEIDAYSPIRQVARGAPTSVWVGELELPELIRHASEYASSVAMLGETIEYMPIATHNHFSILEELASESGILTKALAGKFSRCG